VKSVGGVVLFGQWFNSSAKRKWYIGTDTTNLHFYIDSAGSGTFTSVNAGAYPTDGKFHSYAFVYIPSASLTAYVDGVVVGTDTSSVASSIYSATDVNIYMGRDEAGSYFDGQIGSSKIYTRALSQAEIKQNFNAQASRFQVPRSIVTSGLVLRLDAGDLQSYPGSGSTWYDIASRYSTGGVGANYDGTLVGTTFSTGPSRIVFTGNDEVTWTTKPINAGTFTAMAFFKRTGDSSSNETHCFFNSEGSGDVGFMVSFNESTWLVNHNGQKGTSGVGNYSMSSTTAMTLNTWRHIAVSWNNSTNSGAAKIYIDGVLENTATPVATVSETSSVNFWMGANETNRGLVGDMGTFLGYDRQLSDAEVAQNFRVQRERFGI